MLRSGFAACRLARLRAPPFLHHNRGLHQSLFLREAVVGEGSAGGKKASKSKSNPSVENEELVPVKKPGRPKLSRTKDAASTGVVVVDPTPVKKRVSKAKAEPLTAKDEVSILEVDGISKPVKKRAKSQVLATKDEAPVTEVGFDPKPVRRRASRAKAPIPLTEEESPVLDARPLAVKKRAPMTEANPTPTAQKSSKAKTQVSVIEKKVPPLEGGSLPVVEKPIPKPRKPRAPPSEAVLKEQLLLPYKLRKVRGPRGAYGPRGGVPEEEGPLVPDDEVINDPLEFLKWTYPHKDPKASRYKIAAAKRRKIKGDGSRINVVSEKLCDDVLEYLKPSLSKHTGCDIIDINPGVGLWSRKLHDIVKPRSHILMEPDAAVYSPILEPLVNAPDSKYRLIPRSGLLWKDLGQILTPEYLPHQRTLVHGDPALGKTNDTLLVIAQLGNHPRRAFGNFASMANLVLHQLLHAIRTQSLFNRYGLTRMLIWMNDEDGKGFLPKHIIKRKKAAVQTEVCAHVEEVASTTEGDRRTPRVYEIEHMILQQVLERMKKSGLKTPPGRESELMARVEDPKTFDEVMKRLRSPEIEDEGNNYDSEDGAPIKKKKKHSQWQSTRGARTEMGEEMTKELNDIMAIQRDLKGRHGAVYESRKAKVLEQSRKWREKLYGLQIDTQQMAQQMLDNSRSVQVSPPLLSWDRRRFEPLRVKASEFFPAKTMTLFDVQPKEIWPVLERNWPENYDILEYILTRLYMSPTVSLKRAFNMLAPGIYEWFLQECPSLTNPLKGGSFDVEVLNSRVLTLEMIEEMVEAWERWPFKPSRYKLLSQVGEETHDTDATGFNDDE